MYVERYLLLVLKLLSVKSQRIGLGLEHVEQIYWIGATQWC